jgi:hypothetical protein
MHSDSDVRRNAGRVRRDALLARVTRTRWLTVAGAGALTAALAALAGAVAPGRSSAKSGQPATAKTAAPRPTLTVSMPPAADGAQLGLQPPGSAPQAPPTTPASQAQPQSQPAPAPAAAVSGGS